MTFLPNPEWDAIRQRHSHSPVYFVRFPDAARRIHPSSTMTYSNHAAWTNPGLAIDGDQLTEAKGTAHAVGNVQGFASVVFTFAAGTVAKLRPRLLVSTGIVMRSAPGPFFLSAYFSTDGGSSWSQIGETLTEGSSLLEGPDLFSVQLALFRLRVTTWSTSEENQIACGSCAEAYAFDLSSQRDYATAPVLASSVDKVPWLVELEHEGGRVDVMEGAFDIGSLRFSIADVDGSVLELLGFRSDDPLWKQVASQRVDLFAGYAELPESKYVRVFRGRVSDVQMNADLSEVQFKAEDVKAGFKQSIMTWAREAPTFDTSKGMSTPTYWPEQPIIIEGHPLNVFGAVLTGVFSTTDPDFPLASIVGKPTGCGLDRNLDINMAAIKTARDGYLASFFTRYIFVESVDSAEWCADNIFRIFGPASLDGQGRIGMFPWDPPAVPEIPATITDDDVLSVESWNLRTAKYKNAVTLTYNYDPWERAYTARNENAPDSATATDEADIAATGVRRELFIETQGFYWNLDGYKQARDRAAKILRWLRTPPVEINLLLPFTRADLEVGDVVRVSLSMIPNVRTGGRGVVGLPMRVASVSPDLAGGSLLVTVIEFGYLRHALVMPDALTKNYDAFSQVEKDRYGAIAFDASEAVGSAHDPAYRVA